MASYKTTLIGVLARQNIANREEARAAHGQDGWDEKVPMAAANEDLVIARLCGVGDEVAAQVAKIERERAKEANG